MKTALQKVLSLAKPICTVSAKDGACHLLVEAEGLQLEMPIPWLVDSTTFAFAIESDFLAHIARAPASYAVRVERDRVYFKGASVDYDFLRIPPERSLQTVDAKPARIHSDELRLAIGLTKFSTARDSTRYAINGIHVEPCDGTFLFVSTDGRRMSKAPCRCVGFAPIGGVLSGSFCDALHRLLEPLDCAVSLAIGEKRSLATCEAFTLTGELVEGKFPNWRDVIPKPDKHLATIPLDKLAPILEDLAVPNERGRFQAVRLELSENALLVKTIDGEVAASATLAVQYAGAPCKKAFNRSFLAELCRAVPTNASVSVGEPGRPMLIQVGNYEHVLMPVKESEL